MAGQADGSVIIDTKMDTSGFSKGTVSVQNSFSKMSNSAKKFANAIKSVFSGKSSNSISQSIKDQSEDVLNILNQTERSAKSKAASIAAIYRKQGMSQQDAFTKAWEQIDRTSLSGSERVKKHLFGIGKASKSVGNQIEHSLSFGISGALKKIASLMSVIFFAGQLVEFGKESIELGSDLEEVQNVVDVTFKGLNKEINEFASNAIEQFGLSETAAKQYTSTMGAMLKSMGFTTREAADMSKTMTGLAADMASFYNLNAEDAFYKIRAGISGETEPLKQLGINLNVANLEHYALTQGITKSYNAMTQQEQALLRYNYLLKVTADAQGDFARTSDSWANQTRILTERFKALKATIGQGLINLFTPVIRVINTLLAKLATVANAFKSFTELITGKKSSGATSQSSAGLSNSGISSMEDAYDSAASGAEDYADATEDAADATKKANKENSTYLSGLDEVRRFETEKIEEETPDASTGGLVDDLQDAIEDVDYGNLADGENVLDKTNTLLDKIIKKLKQLQKLFKKGFFDGLGDYKSIFDDLLNDIKSIGKALRDIFTAPDVLSAINKFANSFAYSLGQIAGSFARIGLSIAQNIIGGIEKYLTQNSDRIKQYLISMFNVGAEIATIAGELAKAFADIFSAFGGDTAQQITANLIGIFAEIGMMISETALKLGRDILNMIATPIIENKDKIKTALEGTLQAIEPFTAGVLTLVQNVRDTVMAIYDQHLKPFFDSVANGLSTIFGILLDGYNEYILPVLQGLSEKFLELMEGPFGETISKIETFIGKLIDAIKLLWETILMPFLSWIAENIMPVLAPIIQLIGETALNAMKLIITAIGDIADVLSGLIDFFVGVFTGDWEKAWKGVTEIADGAWKLIKDIISIAWEGIKSVISTAINIVKTAIKTAWEGIKTLSSTIFNAIWNTIQKIWEKISKYIVEKTEGLKNDATKAFNTLKENIVEALGVLWKEAEEKWDWIKEKFNGFLKFLKNVFERDWTQSFGTIGHVANAFFEEIEIAWDTSKKIFEDIISFIDNVFSGNWRAAWDNIKQIFIDAFEGLQELIKAPINAVIGIVNDAIGFINGAIGGVESAFSFGPWEIPTPFGTKRIGFTANFPRVPTVPYLAKGAVIPPNAPFAAVLGDQKHGTNVEAPLSTIEQAVTNAIKKNGSGGQNITIRVPVILDGRQIFEAIIDEAKMKQLVSGRNPFEMA